MRRSTGKGGGPGPRIFELTIKITRLDEERSLVDPPDDEAEDDHGAKPPAAKKAMKAMKAMKEMKGMKAAAGKSGKSMKAMKAMKPAAAASGRKVAKKKN